MRVAGEIKECSGGSWRRIDVYPFDETFSRTSVEGIVSKVASAVEVGNTKEPAAKHRHESYPKLTDEQLREIDERQNESLMGRRMFVQYGGGAEGYGADVIAETEHYLVLDRGGHHKPNVMCRSDRDRLLFDNEADAKEYTRKRKEDGERKTREYEAEIAAKGKPA